MLKITKLFLLFMLVFSGAVLLGNTPVGAQETLEYTYVSVNEGMFESEVDAGVLRDPCYYEPTLEECVPMTEVIEFYMCNGYPAEDLGNCRRFNYGNICFSTGTPGVSWGGTLAFLSFCASNCGTTSTGLIKCPCSKAPNCCP